MIAAIVALGGFALLAAWRDVRSQENRRRCGDKRGGEPREAGRIRRVPKAGAPYGIPPMARTNALQQMRDAGGALAAQRRTARCAGCWATPIQWSPLGPQPIIHGQGFGADGFCCSDANPCQWARDRDCVRRQPSTIYLGTANGGVWKTTDGGGFWTPLTDKEPSLAVGALAVIPNADTTKDVIYVGTGEGNRGCDSEFGQGILKSIDGGRSWTQLGEPTPFDRMAFAGSPCAGSREGGTGCIIRGNARRLLRRGFHCPAQLASTPASSVN